MITRHPVRLFAAVLLLVGMGMAIFGVVRSADGWAWPDEKTVPVDGEEHVVETMNRSIWLWSEEGQAFDGSTCTANDAWGEALDMSELTEHVERPAGDDRSYVAHWELHTYGPTAHIVCEPDETTNADTVIHAEPSPRVIAVASNDPWIVRGVLVGFFAVLIFLGALVVARADRFAAAAAAKRSEEASDEGPDRD